MTTARLDELLLLSRRVKADGHDVHAFAKRVRATVHEARWQRFEKDLQAWTRAQRGRAA